MMSELPVTTPSSEKKRREEDSQIFQAVEQMTQDLQVELGNLAAKAGRSASRNLASRLVRSFARVDEQRTQGAVLSTLLTEAKGFASRTAFFLTRPEGIRCWSSEGFGAASRSVEGTQIGYEDGPAWGELAKGLGVVRLDEQACQMLAAQAEAPAATRGVLVPFVLHGQLGGALYADELEGDEPLLIEPLQLLTHITSQALETLAVRGERTPTLRQLDEDDGVDGVPLWQGSGKDQTASVEPVPAADEPAAVGDSDTDLTEAQLESETSGAEEESGAGAVVTAAAAVAGAVAGMIGLDRESSAPVDAQEPEEPEPATPDITASEDAAPADTVPEVAVPEVAVPEVAVPEVAVPEVAVPEVTAPSDWAAAPDLEPEAEQVDPHQLVSEAPSYGSQDAVTVEEPSSIEPPTFEVADATSADADSDTAGSDLLDAPEFDTAATAVYQEPAAEPIAEVAPQTSTTDDDLDDTASSLWDLEEDEDATVVSTASTPELQPEIVPDPEVELPMSASEMPTSPALAVPDYPVGQQTVRLDVSALQSNATPTVEESAMPEPTLETREAAPWTAGMPAAESAPDASEDPTLMVSRSEVLPSPGSSVDPQAGVGFATPEPPAPKPEPSPTTGSSEVRPPDDIQGPGSAFGGGLGSVPEGEEALHEEARRLARLLVSEIKLYNEEIIEAGRRDSNIYDRHKDDIDRSRQMYEDRIDERIRRTEDYFYLELVQRLAGGNRALLGM